MPWIKVASARKRITDETRQDPMGGRQQLFRPINKAATCGTENTYSADIYFLHQSNRDLLGPGVQIPLDNVKTI